MDDLSIQKCEACKIDAPRLSEEELQKLLPQIPDWKLVSDNEIPQLQKQYAFKNFVLALEFANKVGELAETENHHPAITVEWGKTTVTWWTHKIKGLHRNDVIMAAKTDTL